jgi:hypothetical protein
MNDIFPESLKLSESKRLRLFERNLEQIDEVARKSGLDADEVRRHAIHVGLTQLAELFGINLQNRKRKKAPKPPLNPKNPDAVCFFVRIAKARKTRSSRRFANCVCRAKLPGKSDSAFLFLLLLATPHEPVLEANPNRSGFKPVRSCD